MKFECPLIVLTSLALLFSSHTGFGQSEPVVAVKIHFVAWGDPIPGLSLKSEGKGETFNAESFVYSKPVTYRGVEILEIFQSTTTSEDKEVTPNAPGGMAPPPGTPPPGTPPRPAPPRTAAAPAVTKPAEAAPADAPKSALAQELEKRRLKDPSLVALARIPAACTHATILLQALGDGTYQAYVLNDDPSQLPKGQLRIHNFSVFPISVKIATQEKPFLIKPNQRITVPAQQGSLIYELSYLQDKEWKYQENNIVRVSPNEQTQMFIVRSENQFFVSSSGSIGGFLQNVVLRRSL